jgi:hypothetical protein
MAPDARDFSMTLKVYATCKCGRQATHSVPWTKERVEKSRRKAEEKRAERERQKLESMSLREINERLAEAALPTTFDAAFKGIFVGMIMRPTDTPWPTDDYCDECWRKR